MMNFRALKNGNYNTSWGIYWSYIDLFNFYLYNNNLIILYVHLFLMQTYLFILYNNMLTYPIQQFSVWCKKISEDYPKSPDCLKLTV